MAPTVIKVKTGMEKNARLTAVGFIRTVILVKKKRRPPMTPAMPGATTQAANTCDTPVIPQLILLMPIDAVAEPTRPPTMECVVDTGMPYLVAKVRKVEEPTMAHIMARRRTCGESS
jgi:hypothetical protein